MPFPSVFLGVKDPVARTTADSSGKKFASAVLGWVCEADRTIVLSTDFEGPHANQVGFTTIHHPADRAPTFSGLPDAPQRPAKILLEVVLPLVPLVVFKLIEREARVTKVTGVSSGERRRLRRLEFGKEAPAAPVPKRFHEVVVKGGVRWVNARRKAIVACGPAWRLTHRIDVRGHWWVRVRRGHGAPPPELVERLDPNYLWCSDDSPALDEETQTLLDKRLVRPRYSGEWMAVLKVWVDDHQRGPADGNYVPSAWTVSSETLGTRPSLLDVRAT